MIDQRYAPHWWSSKTAKFLISFAISITFIVVWSFYIWPSFLQSTSVDAEEKSFQIGLGIYKKLTELNVAADVFLWVNDIGLSPEDRKVAQNNYQLPENYRRIAKDYSVDYSKINVLFDDY